MDKYIPRQLDKILKQEATWYPVVSITGPRQSGKSTLAKHVFPEYNYINLENPQIRAMAIEDPVSFIKNRQDKLIIDEAQYAPDLFSVIQEVSDERGTPGQYILSGSQNFLLMKRIKQSLAGRVGLLKLLPFSYSELSKAMPSFSTDDFALRGGYPRMYDANIPPEKYFSDYQQTYIERDIAGLLGVRNIEAFRKFVSICAQYAGNLVNFSSISNAVDTSLITTKSWLSILESSYLIFMLRPYFTNTKKRLTKAPKLYFYDTGLLCSLLRIRSTEQLIDSPHFGAVFENLIISETIKQYLNAGKIPELYFYRDDSKREIDLLDFTDALNPLAIEIKSSRTYQTKYSDVLSKVSDELDISKENRLVVLRVDDSYDTKACRVVSVYDYLK